MRSDPAARVYRIMAEIRLCLLLLLVGLLIGAHSSKPEIARLSELPRAVAAFLHTGDPSALVRANCTARYELQSARRQSGPRAQTQPHSHSHPRPNAPTRGALNALTHATRFLAALLRDQDRDLNLAQWCRALVRSVLEGDVRVHRALVAFDVTSGHAGLLMQATRNTAVDSGIDVQDLTASARDLLTRHTPDTEWYHAHVHKRAPARDRDRHRDRYAESDVTHENPQVKWSAPFLECQAGTLVPRWLLTLSAGFYSLKTSFTPEFR